MQGDIEFYPSNLSVKKQLVLAVCEPFIKEVEVKCRGNSFKMFKFGSFEIETKEFIYGTEEKEYQSSYKNPAVNTFPIIIAQKKQSSYVLFPFGSFSQKELEVIRENITYGLESQQTMARYFATRC